MEKRILFVEDDDKYRKVITDILENEGYHVDAVGAAMDAIELLTEKRYDLIISDLVMETIDGLRFVRYVRKTNRQVKIMLLTAQPTMDTEIVALNLRVDKYLTKETRVDVLLKYIEILLFEAPGVGEEIIDILYAPKDDVEIDTAARTVRKNNELVELTPKEYGILKVLLENHGKAVGRYTLIEEVWDVEYESIDTRVIDVHIKTIRRKLKLQSIISVRGFGYKWDD